MGGLGLGKWMGAYGWVGVGWGGVGLIWGCALVSGLGVGGRGWGWGCMGREGEGGWRGVGMDCGFLLAGLVAGDLTGLVSLMYVDVVGEGKGTLVPFSYIGRGPLVVHAFWEWGWITGRF